MFETHYRVRFHDVDHAGIIFFARIIQYCHDALEDLQRDAGIPLEGFFETREIGAPLVDVKADFRRPFRHGDLMTIRVKFDQVGERSVTTHFECLNEAGEACATVRFVQACIDAATFRPRSWPDDVRAAWTRYLETA